MRARIDVVAVCIWAVMVAHGCRRETRFLHSSPRANALLDRNALRAADDPAQLARYARSAWAISEGERLFSQMNCVGCHAHGGGGMAPALMDAGWRYGSDVRSIARTIVEGRPNGMPAFAAHLSPEQVWELTAFVRSLGGHAPGDAAPVRDDHLAVRPPPSRTDPLPPVQERAD